MKRTVQTEKAEYLIRGPWSEQELRQQYKSFVEKYKSSMDFDRWLTERGKVYVKLHEHAKVSK